MQNVNQTDVGQLPVPDRMKLFLQGEGIYGHHPRMIAENYSESSGKPEQPGKLRETKETPENQNNLEYSRKPKKLRTTRTTRKTLENLRNSVKPEQP